jgi:hypothetical protein
MLETKEMPFYELTEEINELKQELEHQKRINEILNNYNKELWKENMELKYK